MKNIYLSVIIPFYNEGSNLPVLHKELIKVLGAMDRNTEIVYVSDGSTDNSEKVLRSAINKYKNTNTKVKLILLRKNFGQTAATSAGIDNADGKLVSFLDADMQNDPQSIPVFVKEIEKGYDAVFGWRKDRQDKFLRSFLSKAANILISRMFDVSLHDTGCSVRVVKKEYLSNIKMYGEMHRIFPVLIYLKGAKTKELVVNHRPRKSGVSKYGYMRIPKLVIDLITQKFLLTYGTKPAYVFGSLGIISMFTGFITLLMVVYRKLALGIFVHRDPLFLITIFLILLGIQFVLMGLVAELQVRTYFESQDKSIYEISEIKRY